MITLTRPDGSSLLVNPSRIETVEQMPDTIVTLADGKKLLVRETADEVASRFLAHFRAVHAQPNDGLPAALHGHPGDRLPGTATSPEAPGR